MARGLRIGHSQGEVGEWSVTPPVTVAQSASGTAPGQRNIAATGPVGAVPGGVYAVDPAGAALPAGSTLSAAGMFDVGSAVAGVTPNTGYKYFEPGAVPSMTIDSPSTATTIYFGTWYPNKGIVPSGYNVVSPDDPTLRGSVISTYPDGSAAIIVFASERALTSGAGNALRLRPGLPAGGTDLTTARIPEVLSNVTVNFGGGDQVLSSFGSPQKTWWVNPNLICCRYILSCGLGVMRAIIDIHAFKDGVNDFAFVEWVIENGEINCNLANPSTTKPITQNYTNATVKVNGTTISTVSSPSVNMTIPRCRRSAYASPGYIGGHEAFRAWYGSAWVKNGVATPPGGASDPGTIVLHDPASLATHPWFFRTAETNTANLQTRYTANSYDIYEPWATCRIRMPHMSEGGEDEEICLLPMCWSDYVQNANKYARASLLASGVACLSGNFSWRHTDGNLPTRTQMTGKTCSGGSGNGLWPDTQVLPAWGGDLGTHDGAHNPAVGLVPFMCRPSPCFIEIAQKEFCWNATNFASPDAATHPYDQPRARGWRLRNYGMTIFLTPNQGPGADSARKTSLQQALVASVAVTQNFLDQPWNVFKDLFGPQVGSTPQDNSGSRAGYQTSWFMNHYATISMHVIASVGVLSGADQVALDKLADDLCAMPLRWFSDATSYEWRAVPYQPTLGVLSGSTVNQSPFNIQTFTKNEMADAPPSSPGPWLDYQPGDFNYADCAPESTAGAVSYPTWWWFAICAMVERQVSGSNEAWDKIVTNGGISNLATWRQGLRTVPQYNRWPRNK